MTRKLTITVSDDVYKRLHRRIGRRKISRFINDLARQHLAEPNSAEYWLTASEEEIDRAYAEQAAYEHAHANESKEQDEAWLNGLVSDVLTDSSDASR
jgi:predicted CopG family antitoxin